MFVKRIFKNASGFHFTSEYEKEQFVKFSRINTNTNTNKHKCRIIFNPLDISEFQKNVDKNLLQKWNLKNKRYFLYLGRINWKKGIEFLIGAFAKFTDEFILVIAGPDENGYKAKLEKLIKEKGIGSKVIFTGLVKGDDKLCLLKNAEAFILSSYGENFGIAVAEAMAIGTPVIISKYVGLQNVIEKYNAGVVIDLDEEELFQKMKDIIENLELKNLIIKNAYNLVKEQFDPSSIAKQIINFYNEI